MADESAGRSLRTGLSEIATRLPLRGSDPAKRKITCCVCASVIVHRQPDVVFPVPFVYSCHSVYTRQAVALRLVRGLRVYSRYRSHDEPFPRAVPQARRAREQKSVVSFEHPRPA